MPHPNPHVDITTICIDCDVECFCFDTSVEDFATHVEPLLDQYRTFRIEGFPLWNGKVSGTVTADSPTELLRSITVKGDFHLTADISGNTLSCRISHHDVPTGGTFTVTGIPEEDN